MWAGESHAINAVDVAHRCKEISQEWSGTAIAEPLGADNSGVVCRRVECPARAREVTAIGVHVLSEQGDFSNAVICESLHFSEQLAERAADFTTANCGNDAVGTGVVTTDLDRDPG